ncbi:hypothetical protein D6745_04320 [Candidatus Woesearchaeota archaeon]|nr:MAG: hypothetical protein D6745_04320 [Candidatus Woesearchaeota archaeon]
MHETEYQILSLFKGAAHKEFSTDELVKAVYPDEWSKIEQVLNSEIADRTQVSSAKRKKAKLHRKLLYHLNKLVDEEIIEVSRVEGKGIKYFKLALEAGEEFVIERYKRKIIITKPSLPAMPIERYEQEGIVFKFQPESWSNRLNAILIETKNYDYLKQLSKDIEDSFSIVNDVIALNNFECVFENWRVEEIMGFLKKLLVQTRDYGKNINLIINMENMNHEIKNMLAVFREFLKLKMENIDVIFDIKPRELHTHFTAVKGLVQIFSKKNTHIFIKNRDLHESPYLVGKAGTYTFNNDEWEIYKNEFKDNSLGLVCSQCSVIIDYNRFFRKFKTPKEFRYMIKQVATALLAANSLQRRNSQEFLSKVSRLNNPEKRQFFLFSRNYIRFWNYVVADPEKRELLFEVLKSSQNLINKFCLSQETIYKSCGMPTRFRIAFSSVFREADEKLLSTQTYKDLQIRKSEDLYSEETKDFFKAREKLLRIFNGGDRISINRVNLKDAEDACKEFTILLNNYSIPFFRYNFSPKPMGDLKLTQFIE